MGAYLPLAAQAVFLVVVSRFSALLSFERCESGTAHRWVVA
jgi:hypothetical protein